MKRLRLLLAPILFIQTLAIFLVMAPPVHAVYNSAYLISDRIFTDTSTMSINDIQNFLNSMNSGLKNYSDVENCSPPTPTPPDPYAASYYPRCGQSVSAATIIYDAGQAYGINPRSIIATLQKEQSLITTPNPTQSQINCAMGYNSCGGFSGFFNQVDNGTWAFRTYIELMSGRNWWGYTPSSYPCKNASSLYSAGLYPGNTVTFYNPGGQARTITLANASTAALYCYTPHVGPYSETGYSGSYNFVTSFEQWFGSVASPCYNDNNVSGAASGPRIMSLKYNSAYRLTLTQQNNTGSACVEAHMDDSRFQNWLYHLPTGMKTVDPTLGTLVPSTSKVDNNYSLNYMVYNGAGGHVEVHRLSPDLQRFPGYYDVSTDLTGITPSVGTFVAGDFMGRGYDQLLLILYNGGGGHVEIHMFDPTMRSAIGYYDVSTDLVGITSTAGNFVAGDFLGRGYDQLVFVLNSGGGGHVETHMFDPTLRRAIGYMDHSTDLVGITPSVGTFIAGDFLGRRYSQLVYVAYSGGGGHVETHMFDPSLSKATGFQDLITNINSFDPSQ